MNALRFFQADPEAACLWADWLVGRGLMRKDGIMQRQLFEAALQSRADYAAILVRKHPDEFLTFATYRRLTR